MFIGFVLIFFAKLFLISSTFSVTQKSDLEMSLSPEQQAEADLLLKEMDDIDEKINQAENIHEEVQPTKQRRKWDTTSKLFPPRTKEEEGIIRTKIVTRTEEMIDYPSPIQDTSMKVLAVLNIQNTPKNNDESHKYKVITSINIRNESEK